MSVTGAPSPARPTGSSERRPITVVFADIAGSTAIAERMDPEDWTGLIGKALAEMSHTVERFGGTVARLMGDGVLAFFGAPVAHEDDPERAVRCGLQMVQVIDRLGGGLQVRVGVNTGPVVVGVVGTDTAFEYTAMGDAVNVAARMQAAARPGSVLVTAATHRFIAPLVDAVDVGLLELKGKSDAVHAFEVTSIRSGAVQKRGLAGFHSPLVGRDAEIGRLQESFDIARAGQGRVACIMGEPGMGKSRLLAELRGRVEHDVPTARWVEGRCLSYGESVPYHLVLDLVRSLIGVSAVADEAQVAAALEAYLRDLLGDEWQETYAYLGNMLSLKLGAEMQARVSLLEMETLKRYTSSLIAVVRAASARGPLIVVCDDVHWADTSSVDLLLGVMPSFAGLPALLILSSRAERASAGWRMIASARDVFGDALTEIRLQPLSMNQSRELVSNLLTIESLPAETRDLVLARAEGNPFFVEEVIRMLIDHGAIARDGDRWVATDKLSQVEIPDTLHGLLLARIDRLPQDSKRTLRVASVIGRQFAVTLLERLLEERTS